MATKKSKQEETKRAQEAEAKSQLAPQNVATPPGAGPIGQPSPREGVPATQMATEPPQKSANPGVDTTIAGSSDIRDQPSSLGTPISASEHDLTREADLVEVRADTGRVVSDADAANLRGVVRPTPAVDAALGPADVQSPVVPTPASPLGSPNLANTPEASPDQGKGSDAGAGAAPPTPPEASKRRGRAIKWPIDLTLEGSKKRVLAGIDNFATGRRALHGKARGIRLMLSSLRHARELVSSSTPNPNQGIKLFVHVAPNENSRVEMRIQDVFLPQQEDRTFKSLEEFEEFEDKQRDEMAK